VAATASPSSPRLAAPVRVTKLTLDRLWYTVPDGLFAEPAVATVDFAGDPSAGVPRVRIDPAGREVSLVVTAQASRWTARLDLAGIPPGSYKIGIVEHVPGEHDGGLGPDDVYAPGVGSSLKLSAPEYVVWTLDFEGDAASDETMKNTREIAEELFVPMTILWNPRVWTTTQVSRERADAMQQWMLSLPRVVSGTEPGTKGQHEIGLHIHMWTDYVRSASVIPHSQPNWAGRLDGYDVPITSYSEAEQARLIEYGLRLMTEHGLSGVTSFRAGGLIADAATLRAAVANGITADCSATGAGTFGSLRLPWTLAADAQPYRPSRDDANKSGDLPLLEAPTNAGNTYGYTTATIGSIVRADLAMLAKPGEVATARKGLTIVSHPGTIDATERAAIESLFHAFDPLRYDRDAGPVRFVALRQLAQAWR
jgi:hypothetical protein